MRRVAKLYRTLGLEEELVGLRLESRMPNHRGREKASSTLWLGWLSGMTPSQRGCENALSDSGAAKSLPPADDATLFGALESTEQPA